MTRERPIDPDERAVRRASRTVGVQLTVASVVLVVVVVVAAFAFVLRHVKPSRLFFSHHEATFDIGGLDLLTGAIAIGIAAIVLAAVLSWVATRRAVRPLGQALRLQRAFVANAGHELRTPLAVLDARLQYLQRRLAADDPSAATVAELRRDTATLVQIVTDLLATAEDAPAHAESVDVDPVVRLAVESMGLIAAERGITISFDGDDEIRVALPAVAIHRCVVALLDNALKHSPDGAAVEVRLHAAGGSAELSVRDHGTGIRGIDPAAVFDRFARGEPDAELPGSGIGLALVRDTVGRIGGDAIVTRTGPDGTEISLRLPRTDIRRRRPRGA